MLKKDLGVVLKRFLPNKNKLSIISFNKGKIEIITNPISKCYELWPGMLISFNIQRNFSKIFSVQNTEIIFIPQYDHISNMFWIHKLLELSYYFCPLEKPSEKVFKHLINCLKYPMIEELFKEESQKIKKIFILKLLELFGFYPKKSLSIYLKLYKDISSMYIDFTNEHKVEFLKGNLNKITKKEIKQINKWILTCIASHPNFRSFKTVFFKKVKHLTQYP